MFVPPIYVFLENTKTTFSYCHYRVVCGKNLIYQQVPNTRFCIAS